MRNIVFLQNQITNYPWGDPNTLNELYGVENKAGLSQSELCMGANAVCGSFVQKGRKYLSLGEIVEKNPEAVLGQENALKYNSYLPYLFKVVVVDKPVGVQVNPNAEQAFVGHARENLLEVALNDPKRNYVDPFGKPEIIYAVKPFWLMYGFRPLDEIKANLAVLTPRFFMEHDLAHADLKTLFKLLLGLSGEAKRLVLEKALQNLPKLNNATINCWITKLSGDYSDDIGILMPALLNLVYLEAGQALYVAPRVVNCFLQGVALSLSGNSRNLLRCALTQNHMDIDEFSVVTAFESTVPKLIESGTVSALETAYKHMDVDFGLSVINMPVDGQIFNQKTAVPEIIFCAEGRFTVTRHGHKTGLVLKRGEAMFVSYSVGGYNIKGQGLIYKAALV